LNFKERVKMTPEELKKIAVDSYVEMKSESSKLEATSAFVPPILFWHTDQEENNTTVIAMPDLNTLDLGAIVIGLKEKLGEPKSIMFLSDAHAKIIPQEDTTEEFGNYERGQYAKDFDAGKADISECLVFMFLTLDEISGATALYHYDENTKQIVFKDDINDLEFLPGMDAVVPSALTKAFMPGKI